jgi:hypothetical protein
MFDANEDALPRQQVRTMQIIMAGLLSGSTIFLVIALALRTLGNLPQPPGQDMLTNVGVLLTAGILLAHALLPRRLLAAQRRNLAQAGSANDRGAWCGVFQTNMIIRAALIEGAVYFWLIAYLVEGRVWSPIVALVGIGILALHFPTRSLVERRIDQQRDLLAQEQMTP